MPASRENPSVGVLQVARRCRSRDRKGAVELHNYIVIYLAVVTSAAANRAPSTASTMCLERRSWQ
jgi:hypothetical protein